MMQTASAFGSVQGALSFFITTYRTLAEWQAVLIRLDGFEAAIVKAQALDNSADIIKTQVTSAMGAVELRDLLVQLPNGAPLVETRSFSLRQGERTLVTGPSGAGKSTLFRAIAGIWPFGKGEIRIPETANLMMLPQRPYFPVGTLAEAITYPGTEGTFDAAQMQEALVAVGLSPLATMLNEHGHWNRTLSLGEQQRIGIARALLHAPQFLFLDEATASLDEPAELMLYKLLMERLPTTTIISIGHRSTLDALHQRHIVMVRNGQHFELRDRKDALDHA